MVEIIQQCVKSGEKILVCAPSNIAVDNLLERLGRSLFVSVSPSFSTWRHLFSTWRHLFLLSAIFFYLAPSFSTWRHFYLLCAIFSTWRQLFLLSAILLGANFFLIGSIFFEGGPSHFNIQICIACHFTILAWNAKKKIYLFDYW